mmetsp:Transcript_16013/g.14477  ORF Transcript_16013/g.14477 Transcript_16013/m.14477 type:complete len:397 (-) Transcript_16013:1012-2202(-)
MSTVAAPIESADDEVMYPNMLLSQLIFRYDNLKSIDLIKSNEIKITILSLIEQNDMVYIYEKLASKYDWIVDQQLVDQAKLKISTQLKVLADKQEEIVKNSGDIELLDIISNKGKYFARVGDWINAIACYDEIIAKPKAGSGRKIDAYFGKTRIALFNSDISLVKSLLADTTKLIESGGDWDRRNKLKVYEAMYSMLVRDIKKSAVLLESGIATFSSTEICSYAQFMFYAIVTNVLTLTRSELKKKLIDNAHVISVLVEAPKLQLLIDSLYACNYKQFMRCLLDLQVELKEDRYLGPHIAHIMREFRVLAFSQFLEAYKSVLLSSMADAFGITVSLLDGELSHFIAAGRLNAKIDKVGDLVETTRSDKRNTQYQDVIKKGDALLNQIQQLVRVIDQ